MTNKKIIITALTIAVLGTGVLGVSAVKAVENTNWHQSLIAKLAAKFNVSQSEMQSVFDENRTAQQTEMTQNLTERLSQAVTDGKITESQKQAILDYQAKVQQQRTEDMNAWQSMTPEERKAAMEKRRTEMEQWAKDNNLDLSILRQYVHEFGGRGMMTGRGMGMMGRWK